MRDLKKGLAYIQNVCHITETAREIAIEAIERAIKAEERIAHGNEIERLKAKLADTGCEVCGGTPTLELSDGKHNFCSFACLNQWAEER